MTGWLQASLRAHVVLVLGCAALVVLGVLGTTEPGLGLLALGVPHGTIASGTAGDAAVPGPLPLSLAAAILVALALAVLAATRAREAGRWALLAIAAVTAVSRVVSGAASGELLVAAAISAAWLLLSGLLFLPSSTEWFRDARSHRDARP
ncbi:hypothetical protein [Agrococcus sp. KRD186]|uniref:hypothetical protein n=1 Tax=Agrococcus sp. KRD186 TaxID=2729730 RepID=UPI0019D30B9E|nr:hypothetical protein [Agrococcus sp. KRD186]